MDYLVECKDCNGVGEREYYYFNRKNHTRIEKIDTCKTCNGKGKVVKKKSYFLYELLELNRYIDYYWKILKHKLRIPDHYIYNATKECDKCNGRGEIENKTVSEDGKTTIIKYIKCDQCNGKGIIYTTTIKEIYESIFNSYINSKNQRKELYKILDNKEWNNEKYQEYRECLPDKMMQVCIRCSNYLDGTDGHGGMDSCCGCVNESMCNDNGYSYFRPINQKAKDWYNNGGYKCNLCYDPNHNYKIN